MAASFVDSATLELTKLLAPLSRLKNGRAIAGFVRDLGWEFPGAEIAIDLTALVGLTESTIATIGRLATAQTDEQRLAELETLADQVLKIVLRLREDIPRVEAAIRALPQLSGKLDDLAADLAARVFDWLVYTYLVTHRRRLFAVMHVLGIVEVRVDAHGKAIRTVDWSRIALLFSDPMKLANDVYGWTTAFDGEGFLARTEYLMRAFLLPGGLYVQSQAVRQALARTDENAHELRIPVYQIGKWPVSYAEFAMHVSPVPANGGGAGLVVYPSINGGLAVEAALGSGWNLRIRGTADLAAGFGVQLRPPHALSVNPRLFGGSPVGISNTRLEARVSKVGASGGLSYIFGSSTGSHLGVREIAFNALVAVTAGPGGTEELGVEFEVTGLSLAISGGQGDGFIQKILAGVNIQSTCDLALGYSSIDGVYFRGSGGLAITIPVHKSIGPILIESLLIGVNIAAQIEVKLAASFGARIGPVSASVKDIGLRIPIAFPTDRKGNLGPLDIKKPEFLPPTGAGLVVDAGGISGGGFLDFNKDEGRYSGILQLSFGEIALVAIGLITTKMPDGSMGFSMLLIIAVEFSPAIQLSFGFTLSGVGGLIGIHRTMMVDVLRDGLKKGTVGSILFPKDPILNANKIISDLRSVFPPEEGRFIIGPMVKIGWGNNLITADLAILIELPEPIRIVILGRLLALLPEEKDPIVVIRVDVLGVIEFAKKSLSIDATLFDSHILKYDLKGDAALRLTWGDNPKFAMSLGGFHPAFSPPPKFPELRRLSLSLSSGSSLELSCKVYQALTPNTLQFGARLDVHAEAAGASLDGDLSFDTLIYFSPFSFTADISGHVSVRYKGHKLAGVRLSLSLSGPTPWRAKGKASFEILCWDVTARFDKRWGRDDAAVLKAIDPWDTLQEALAAPTAWGASLPGRRRMVERLKAFYTTTGVVVVHPIGRLEIRQKVLPLALKLDMFNNAPIKGHHTFRITELQVCQAGGTPTIMDRTPLKEFFARAQFEELSKKQKLSLPSFEELDAGIRASTNDVALAGAALWRALKYESIVIDGDLIAREAPAPAKARLQWAVGKRQLKHAAAKRAMTGGRSDPMARFKVPRWGAKIRTIQDGYIIVQRADMVAAAVTAIPSNDGTLKRVEADRALAAYVAAHPDKKDAFMVVPAAEVLV